ncbi:MAG TPA: tripartite tricarboxylate transporter substrate-binding protein [Burkholderiaceae bacterium]|nr:tripartite tricarboxylate transporter substrate-binding protein [Burkholderiaceae bacterium]
MKHEADFFLSGPDMTGRLRWWTRVLLLAMAAMALPSAAVAQDWPNGTVRLVVPFPPGGPTDVISRLLAQKLADRIGQPVIVDNKPGAAGNIGAEFVARAKPDGQTLLYGNSVLITNPHLVKGSLQPDELAPVFQVLTLSPVLVVHPSLPARSPAELLALIKTRPRGVTCGSVGSVFTIGCALLEHHAGREVLRVPYRGQAPAMNALIGGEVDILFDTVATSEQQVKAGRVKVLATAATRRERGSMSSVPMMAETVPGFDLSAWQGILAPKGTPTAMVRRINQQLQAVFDLPEVKARILELGSEPVGGSPETFASKIQEDAARYGKVLRDLGIKPE